MTAMTETKIPDANVRPQRFRDPCIRARLGEAELAKLKGAALRRKTTANQLAARLLRTILHDGLIEAVLDDSGKLQ